MENYYLEEFEKMRNQKSYRQEQWFGKRGELVETFSWAIPNEEAIQYIANRSPIVEIGAGKGYWSRLLRDAGAELVAYDIDPPEEDEWTSVEQGTENMLKRFNEEYTLFLCWPPYGEPMAANALKQNIEQGGTDVIYVGEGHRGCTGDDEFHQILRERYALMESIEIPSYEGIHDNLYHYRRKI